MGADLYEAFSAFRAVYDHAEVDFDLKKVTLRTRTASSTRPATPSPAWWPLPPVTAVLREKGITPVAAGLSLGEYSALHAAGVFDAATAIRLVAFRGKAMEEAAAGRESAMMAVLNLDRSPLQDACDAASDLGCVVIANYNCPGQLVIGGEKAAVEKAAAIAKEKGARRACPEGQRPFHTP
ncbi:MAG: ACP S-malonyltransferase [Dysosmobacter welbionis]